MVQTRFSEEFSRKRNSHAVSTDGPIAVHASAHSPSPIEYVRETKRRRNSLNSPPSSSLGSRASTDTSSLSSTPTPELDAYADWIRETHGAVESSSALCVSFKNHENEVLHASKRIILGFAKAYHLLTSTTALACVLFDKFLSVQRMRSRSFEPHEDTVALTCGMIAAKFREGYSFRLSQVAQVGQCVGVNTTPKEIQEQEMNVITVLKWDLDILTAVDVVESILTSSQQPAELQCRAIELALDATCLPENVALEPSRIALATIWVASMQSSSIDPMSTFETSVASMASLPIAKLHRRE